MIRRPSALVVLAVVLSRCIMLAGAAGVPRHAFANLGGDNCFVLMEKPLAAPPFSNSEVSKMVSLFHANLNVNGTGAVIASPGSVPALNGSCPGDYRYHWMRDGALSMKALLETYTATGGTDTEWLAATASSYVSWVASVHGSSYDAFGEPKWNISTKAPYAHGWCRPQTDGPGLRATTLIAISDLLLSRASSTSQQAWQLATLDLDWIASGASSQSAGSVNVTCDLWEETIDSGMAPGSSSGFLWNRVTMRSALDAGATAATARGDKSRASAYASAALTMLSDPFKGHLAASSSAQGTGNTPPLNNSSLRNAPGYFTECPADTAVASDSCNKYGKQIDTAVILSLIHGGSASVGNCNDTGSSAWTVDPRSATVAGTVAEYNRLFCSLYPINQWDSGQGVPGVVYGRYAADGYGGGNPWVLTTAALATVLYNAAIASAASPLQSSCNGEALSAWQDALASPSFDCSASQFIAAGDSVMSRLRLHVDITGGCHLYEQIDRDTGFEYNAKDLTWSYAETLSAVQRRQQAATLSGL